MDGLINFACLMGLLYVTGWDAKLFADISLFDTKFIVLFVYGNACFVIFHGYLLYKNGQTLGKWVFDISIVANDGSRLSLTHILFKRYFPIMILGFIPIVGRFICWVDGLFIFRKNKRCLHDLIASSKVIQI
ncbi:RDD family protein [Vibrio aphrogenes]|uniref:RDD family protein n=1 Tax=Vibrio aphrogenes TaxID=1891186 RepID=UPI000B362FF7